MKITIDVGLVIRIGIVLIVFGIGGSLLYPAFAHSLISTDDSNTSMLTAKDLKNVQPSKILYEDLLVDQKKYYRHSGYMGGEKMIPFRRMLERKPEWVIERAVKGMLPKNALGRQMAGKLRVYAGPEHPHEAQGPQPLEF